ncbi:M20 family metallopeptidase [Bacillus thermotolerans]|uniref:M20 metallopeptidase family protein n=1 Tax=Bacillus thermotolerans TaxID=1221996 RepID=UPI000588F6A8|nr:amidohydrolase [Bacillus thermotolerans]KKB40101.1 N-acetyl-L,L-diaminopimelate deacetylase [Bacillus thermotolerans]
MAAQEKPIALEAQEMEQQFIKWRRHLHQYPELSFQEYKTAAFIADELQKIEGLGIETHVGKTGVVATLSNGSGKTVAIRADMDALPIEEKTGHHFMSKHPGVMHACGHDAHTAILLGIAHLLSGKAKEGSFQGTVKLIFQPAEEATDEEGLSGAPRMMEEGVLDGVDAVLALHMCPWQPTGVIQVNDGYSMANVDVFHGEIFGTGGHGGYPHLGTDPIWMLGHVLQAFYSITSRKISPLDTAVASIGEVRAGAASNVIPDKVSVTGTLRTYSPEERDRLAKEIEAAFQVVVPLGGTYQLTVDRGEPALTNDPAVNEVIKRAARQLYPGLRVVRKPFGLGGEDFGYMTRKIPGAMFFLGCSLPDGIDRDLHTNVFDLDERCLPMGAAILAQSAIDLLHA